jgi:beta-xylosidase
MQIEWSARRIFGIAQGGVPGRTSLRIVNDRQEVDFYFRIPDKSWQRTQESAEISGMHHDVLGGFLDVRPAVYACGSGKATLRNFRYWPEVNVPV